MADAIIGQLLGGRGAISGAGSISDPNATNSQRAGNIKAMKQFGAGMEIGAAAYNTYSGFKAANQTYQASLIENENLRLQAEQVELQMTQQMNNLNSDLQQGLDDLQYQAVMRGGKATSGNFQTMATESSNEVFKQNRGTQRQGQYQAKQLRLEADKQDALAKAQKQATKASLTAGLITSVAKGGMTMATGGGM